MVVFVYNGTRSLRLSSGCLARLWPFAARRVGGGDEAGVTDRLLASPPRDTAMLPLPARFAGLILP
jgi:hypothetical protein